MTVQVTVPIPALLPHQVPDVCHPARFKVLRKGRRWGKDRLAFHAAWFGHGPGYSWPGILEGWDVAWLAPDFKQGRGIWSEEIVPRFVDHAVPGVSVNQQDRTVLLEGCGGLYFYSAENITAIRGLGKRLKGIVINEAAHLNLQRAWRDVIRPALMDNHGWALIMSTTNSGTDGGEDDHGNQQVPSFFNALCEEIAAGRRGDDWAAFYGTAEENPKIAPSEFQALVAEYPLGSVALEEEVYAKLLTPGKGLAFPEWRDDVHVVDRIEVPKHWRWGAGFDWGYWQPSAFTLFAAGEQGQLVVTAERRWTQRGGLEIGHDVADCCLDAKAQPDWIAADSSMWGVPASRGFPNQAEEIQGGINQRWAQRDGKTAPPLLLAVPKGKDSRLVRASLLHKYLAWTRNEDGTYPPGGKPRLRFLRSCGYCITSIPRLPPDPKRPEDVDTTADDHAYDAATYYLLSRPLPAEAVPLHPDYDAHPGYDYDAKRRKPKWQRAFEAEEPVLTFTPGPEMTEL